MEIEAVLLTGGASLRMGCDKGEIKIRDKTIAERIVQELRGLGIPITVLGNRPIEGCRFLKDEEAYAGPARALSKFVPEKDYVFVVSCDIPNFDAKLVPFLYERSMGGDVAIPRVDGELQPLCALYKREAFGILKDLVESGEKRVMGWIKRLRVKVVEEDELFENFDPWAIRNINTPEELEHFLSSSSRKR
ncbi:MAG TPA: molybdenum cofactor guanylyltransferase [Fimbriimonadales bacterium]|nr:molybdenum cofactor guanylyltransferase [Fimbriimonadales bacterium]